MEAPDELARGAVDPIKLLRYHFFLNSFLSGDIGGGRPLGEFDTLLIGQSETSRHRMMSRLDVRSREADGLQLECSKGTMASQWLTTVVLDLQESGVLSSQNEPETVSNLQSIL